MFILYEVKTRVWCEVSREVGRVDGSHIAAAEVSFGLAGGAGSVSVLIDNSDGHCMAAYFFGAFPHLNKRVGRMWQEFIDGAEKDFPSPKAAMRSFKKFVNKKAGWSK